MVGKIGVKCLRTFLLSAWRLLDGHRFPTQRNGEVRLSWLMLYGGRAKDYWGNLLLWRYELFWERVIFVSLYYEFVLDLIQWPTTADPRSDHVHSAILEWHLKMGSWGWNQDIALEHNGINGTIMIYTPECKVEHVQY